jgi:hypothetical protein
MKNNARLLTGLALVVLLGAGCSSSHDKPATAASGANTGDANRQQGLKFSQCMRDNGVSAFPDPDASGELTIDGIANGSSLDTSSTAFRKALDACKNLEPSGFTGHKRTPAQQKAGIQFAQCIRDNGVKNFPDPDPNGPLIDVDASNPTYKAALHAAMQKCRTFSAQAGVTKQ